MDDVMKIIKSLKEFGVLVKGVTKRLKNEAKEQGRGFRSMLLGILGASLSENLLLVKGV